MGVQVDHIFPVLSNLKWLLLKIHWRSIDLIGTLTQPMLFISGGLDAIVPPPMLRRLHAAATASTDKELLEVEDGGHNDTFQKGGVAYARRVEEFVYRVLTQALGAEARPRASRPEEELPRADIERLVEEIRQITAVLSGAVTPGATSSASGALPVDVAPGMPGTPGGL